MNDLSLRQSILDELEWEPSIDAANIGVAVKDGIATLTGHVSSFPQKLTIERLVGRIKGVKGYAEEIEVRLPGAISTNDEEIAHRAVNSLHWIDPRLRYARPYELLRPGGAMAVAGCLWARPADAESFWTDVQEDYRAVGFDGDPPPPPERIRPQHLPAEAEPLGRPRLTATFVGFLTIGRRK